MRRRSISGLYVIIDPEACRGRDAVDVARLALEGGAAIVQWRDKRREKGDQLPQAREGAVVLLRHDRGEQPLAPQIDDVGHLRRLHIVGAGGLRLTDQPHGGLEIGRRR